MASDPDFYNAKIAGWWAWGINIYLGSEWPVLGRTTVPRSPNIRRTGVHRKLSHLSTSKKDYQDDLFEYFEAIAARLRYSMVYCGDWSRTVTPCILNDAVPTGIFLDPPYSKKLRHVALYSVDEDIAEAVRHWDSTTRLLMTARRSSCLEISPMNINLTFRQARMGCFNIN